MKRSVAIWPLALLLGIVVLGCEPPKPAAKTSGPPGPPPAPPETKVGVYAGGIDDLAAPVNAPSAAPATATVTPPPAEPATEIVKAGKGVGAAGRSLDQHEGLVVTPVQAYFAARERIFFEAEFPHNYQLWEATADGTPKNFDELKEKFLDPQGLTKKLPKLPTGQKYVWNPETKELGVERPKPQ